MLAFGHKLYDRIFCFACERSDCLLGTHPHVYHTFREGHSVACKTSDKFSAISMDHHHEQITIFKGSGGAVGSDRIPRGPALLDDN